MTPSTLASRVLAFADRHAVEGEPFATDIAGFSVMRHFRPTELLPVLYQPIFCLVLQGAKQAMLGKETITFTQGQSVIVSLDLPTFARVVVAERDRPYLALALEIDMSIINELAAEIDAAHDDREAPGAVASGAADGAILNAMERLFALIDQPAASAILRPLILREIHFWLLSAEHGGMLRQLARASSNAARISEAIAQIRRGFDAPLRIPEIARAVGMSESAFHHHFKAICGTTPLQFQKRLRLIEARRRIIAEGLSVSAAAAAVGYESPTQFSREFARMFGTAPRDYRPSRAHALGGDHIAAASYML